MIYPRKCYPRKCCEMRRKIKGPEGSDHESLGGVLGHDPAPPPQHVVKVLGGAGPPPTARVVSCRCCWR